MWHSNCKPGAHRTSAADSILHQKPPSYPDPAYAAMHPESNPSSEDLAGLKEWSRFENLEQLDSDQLHSLRDNTEELDGISPPALSHSPWSPFHSFYDVDDHLNAYAPSEHRGLVVRTGCDAHDSGNGDLAFLRPPSRPATDDDDDDQTSFRHAQPAAQHGGEGEFNGSAKASFDRHQGPSQILQAQAVPSSIELPPQQERSSGDSPLEMQDAFSYKESGHYIRVPPNPFVQRGILQDLPILFGTKAQKSFFAIPDTGATLNVVNYTFLRAMSSDDISDMVAARQGDTDSDDLEMANGDVVSTMGQVTLSCAFLDTPSVIMDIAFHVCKSLAENVQVVFGKPFLDATSTLTAHSHRLIERSVGSGRFPKVMRMCIGQPDVRLNMRILMNTTVTLAYPDTGSEIDLISRDFVGQIGLPVSELEIGDPYRVQFATGGPQKLLGKILVKISIPEYGRTKGDKSLASSKLIVDGEERDSSTDEEQLINDLKLEAGGPPLKLSQERAFYVVGNLHCNVILGQAFLHAVDAFKAQKHAFLQSDSAKFRNTLNGIFVLSDAQTTKRDLDRALNEVDGCWVSSKWQLETQIGEARDHMRDSMLEDEITCLAWRIAKLETELRAAEALYHEDIEKVKDAFEKARAARQVQNLPATTNAPKEPRKLWPNFRRS